MDGVIPTLFPRKTTVFRFLSVQDDGRNGENAGFADKTILCSRTGKFRSHKNSYFGEVFELSLLSHVTL